MKRLFFVDFKTKIAVGIALRINATEFMAFSANQKSKLCNDQEWSRWFQSEAPRFLLYARQKCEGLAEAEDVLQEALVRVWKIQRGEFPPNPFLLFQSLRRIAVDHARKRIRRKLREDKSMVSEEHLSWFTDPVEGEESHQMLENALKSLPVEQQEVVLLKLWGELTYEQIAELTGVSGNTAASRYRYALQSLEKSLGGMRL